LRSLYYPHGGEQSYDYGFYLTNTGDGEDPDRSDVIEWSKRGSAIVGSKSAAADTVHRVQLMVLEEGNHDYEVKIQKTGLYARLCGDAALIPKDENDDTDYSFANAELYQPLLISDGVVGMNCRVLKDKPSGEKGGVRESENDKDLFEDEFAESNRVPYKVELTFFIENPDENFRSQTRRAPMVRIVRIPVYEQSLDGTKPPNAAGDGARPPGGGRR
ncbi:MAG: hypothetical protein J6T01_04400, partial [Kiritimatiellae bacterium]|nr:hypothetical protein [Kiritimatiellia bacterium]